MKSCNAARLAYRIKDQTDFSTTTSETKKDTDTFPLQASTRYVFWTDLIETDSELRGALPLSFASRCYQSAIWFRLLWQHRRNFRQFLVGIARSDVPNSEPLTLGTKGRPSVDHCSAIQFSTYTSTYQFNSSYISHLRNDIRRGRHWGGKR